MLAFGMLAAFTPCIASAELDVRYSFNQGGDSISIDHVYGAVGDVVLPGEIDNLPVTVINNGAFNNNEKLTSITIPEGVTRIADSAIVDCIALKSVTIPNSVTLIQDRNFRGCAGLRNIYYDGTWERWNQISPYYNGSEEQFRELNPYFPEYKDFPGVTIHCSGAEYIPPTEDTEQLDPEQPTEDPEQPPETPEQPDPEQPGSYSDVPSNHWAYDNVKKITELGAFKGYGDGSFKPENQITHEEFIKVVMSLEYYGDVNAAPASPLSAGWADWAKPFLNAAIDAGVVTAADSDLLAVNTPISRAEMAKVISRTFEYLGTPKADNPDTSNITDWNSISAEYQPYVADVYARGIITGYPEDGTFRPANSLTRAEASTVIVRMLDAQ